MSYAGTTSGCYKGHDCALTSEESNGKFNNTNIVGDGLTVTAKLAVAEITDGQAHVIRPTGEVNYKYCYDINVGEITACKPGKC